MDKLHPILAVSWSRLADLNTDDVNEVARFWNGMSPERKLTYAVFTKCKEALEEGRRFENLSWRLWFRQSQQSHQNQQSLPTKRTAQHLDGSSQLSEPELSTDESVCSEDSEGDATISHTAMSGSRVVERPKSSNAFTTVIPSPELHAPWEKDIEKLVKEARLKRSSTDSNATQRSSHPNHDVVSDKNENSSSIMSMSATPNATSAFAGGAITPRAPTPQSSADAWGSVKEQANEHKNDELSPTSTTPMRHTNSSNLSQLTPLYDSKSDSNPPPDTHPERSEAYSETSTPRAVLKALSDKDSNNTKTPKESVNAPNPDLPHSNQPQTQGSAAGENQSKTKTTAEPSARLSKRSDSRSDAHQRTTGALQGRGNRSRRSQEAIKQKSHERLAARTAKGGNASRAQIMQMLAMTHAEPEGKPAETSNKKRASIKFTTGADEASDEEETKSTQPVSKPDDDEWSEVDEEEEKRLRIAKRAEAKRARREREERERIEMFKKRPIRSMSLADLSSVQPSTSSSSTTLENDQMPPTRGLLSTIFHPPNQQRLPSRNSVHNLESNPVKSSANPSNRNPMSGKTLNLSALPERKGANTETNRNTSAPSYADLSMARRHSTQIDEKMASRSKSAIALPMLNMTALRSTTGRSSVDARNAEVMQRSVSSQSTATNTSGDETPPSPVQLKNPPSRVTMPENRRSQTTSAIGTHGYSQRSKSSTALARLAALANINNEAPATNETRSGLGLMALRPMLHKADHSSESLSHASSASSSVAEGEGPFLSVEADLNQSDDYLNLKRVPQPESATTSPIPSSLPAIDAPVPPLQSPRTTRQNMLRDELSESLRQNLLWERNSRARLLGMRDTLPSGDNSGSATPVPSRRSASHSHAKSHNDLRLYEEQSFHHKGW
ncbi:hypothetical protein MPSI1_001904 [Malassezia psittaci]|uniref:Nitrogen regulatory protein areA GATA-like domain-containing protein n=1 Tax=Malassezia psittaci TaxID=1821823 RepID=A0AAF0JE67_9BASI|nr:hypothetical protein MPSI1_001904 [Malassezia psittaci]